jgi:peptidoglycan/LPS O-acetylase OafA/YrhL
MMRRTIIGSQGWRPALLADDGAGLVAGAGSRANNFNLIRMLAASGVLISHAFPIALGVGAAEPFQSALQGISLGSICVYLFFAVSGYFIAQSFERSRSHRRFVRARILRLFPALVCTLIVTILVAWLFYTTAPPQVFAPAAASYFLRNVTLFFLQYPLPGVFEGNPYGSDLNGSLWTLNYEVLCYVGVFVAGLSGFLRRPVLVAAGAGLLILMLIGSPSLDLPHRLNNLVDLGTPFAIGVALYVWRDRVPLNAAITAVLAVLAVALHGTPLFKAAFVIALSYGVFWLGCLPSRLLHRYNHLGDYSYGMYIYAFPVQQLFAYHGATTPWLNMALSLPVTLVLAVLSWELIEKRALSLK